MTRGIEREMYDRLLAVSEKTIVALEKGHAELKRMGDLIEGMDRVVAEKCRTDERMGMWMKLLAGMVGVALGIIALLQALA